MRYPRKELSLTEGVVWRRILLFALPILAGSLFQQLYTTADAIIIGRFAGKEALAAIDVVYNLTKLPVNFFAGVSSGATILISQYYGAQESARVSRASHTAVLFAFFGGLVLSITGILMAPFCLDLLQVPDDIYQDALLYVRIYFGGLAASMTYNMGAGIFRAVGNSKIPFYFLIVTNVLNILLDMLFVAVFKWGVVGVAMTTVLSQILSAALIISALKKTNLPCRISLNGLQLHRKQLHEIVKLGLPVGVQSTLYPFANMMIQANINEFGTDSIAAWAVCGKLDFFVWLITDALCITIATFVAQNYGAQKNDRAKAGVRIGIIMSMTLVGLIGAILYFWNVPLGYMFVDDSKVIAISSQVMSFLAPLYVVYVFGGVLPGAIRGTGETLKPMLMTLTGSCVSRIFWVLFIVPLHPTLFMVIGCYPVSWGITSLIYLIYYGRHMKRLKAGNSGGIEYKKTDTV